MLRGIFLLLAALGAAGGAVAAVDVAGTVTILEGEALITRAATRLRAVEGVRLLAKSAARQWGPDGIRVNCLAPAPEHVPIGVGSGVLALSPPALGGAGDVERDLGPIVAWLLSDDAHFVTGITLCADGGVWMAP